jgi:hypothetical protein
MVRVFGDIAVAHNVGAVRSQTCDRYNDLPLRRGHTRLREEVVSFGEPLIGTAGAG